MRALTVLAIILTVTCAALIPAFSQTSDTAKPAAAAAPAPDAQAKETAIYGEVQAVNAQAGTISVQYYDYDSDSEKTAEIAVGSGTKMENMKALGDIKKGDWVDVTYTMSGAKFTAKSISVEKEEPESPAGAAGAGSSASEE